MNLEIVSICLSVVSLVLVVILKAQMQGGIDNLNWATKRLDNAVKRQWDKTTLTWRSSELVNDMIVDIIKNDKDEIIKSLAPKFEEMLKSEQYIQDTIKSASDELMKDVVKKGSDQYVKEHLPEIVAKLDVQAVSNAMMLSMTGKILSTQGLLSNESKETF